MNAKLALCILEDHLRGEFKIRPSFLLLLLKAASSEMSFEETRAARDAVLKELTTTS